MKDYSNQRVAAVFRANGKYVLRQICKEGLKKFGTEGEIYSFPGTNLAGSESIGDAAVRAARKWGFDVKPGMIVQQRDTIYVVCEDVMQVGPPEENDRKLRLATGDEIMHDPCVRQTVKDFLKELSE